MNPLTERVWGPTGHVYSAWDRTGQSECPEGRSSLSLEIREGRRRPVSRSKLLNPICRIGGCKSMWLGVDLGGCMWYQRRALFFFFFFFFFFFLAQGTTHTVHFYTHHINFQPH
eukprot:GHVO01043518.1.p1 GENE.GHVO01043518.1~~GHVO01043518.1.p1  ORF type:complete len:114 (+),score=18.20 GHVO01043518.1:97-438(+)